MIYYILDKEKRPVPTDMEGWVNSFEDRVLRQEFIGDFQISTIFLGIDHGFEIGGTPILFETMVFAIVDGETDFSGELQWRCASYNEAMAQHQEAVAFARRKGLRIVGS